MNWDDSHLYLFVIKGIKYAFLDLDELVVEDFDGAYLSCDIPLRELLFTKDEIFYYTYDFGDKHKFCLKILSEMSTNDSNNIPILIGYKGNNVSQYPLWINGVPTFQFDNSTPADILNKKIEYYDNGALRWKVRFIQYRDFEVLQKWRNSEDKRKWEKSVVLLENDTLSFKEISAKIERPIKKLKDGLKFLMPMD